MKKFVLIALVVLVVLSFAACGRRNDQADDNATTPTTDMNILPDTGDMDSNIPDADVNGNSTDNNAQNMVPDGNNNSADNNNGNNNSNNGSNNGNNNGMGDILPGDNNTGNSK